MALDPTELRDEIDAQFAALIGSPYTSDAELRESIKTGLCTIIAEAIHAYLVGGGLTALPGATVVFDAGTMTGIVGANLISADGGRLE